MLLNMRSHREHNAHHNNYKHIDEDKKAESTDNDVVDFYANESNNYRQDNDNDMLHERSIPRTMQS